MSKPPRADASKPIRADASKPPRPDASKPIRADARRNYERLLVAAREAVAEHGTEASLDDIAKRAGVGSGTLYRHFPNRPALLEAVFRDQIQLLYERAQALQGAEPLAALTEWMTAFVDYMLKYRGLAMTLKNMFDAEADLFTECHEQLRWSVDTLLKHAQDTGRVRSDVTGSDLLRLGSGIGMVSDVHTQTPEQSKRLLSVVMDGLRN